MRPLAPPIAATPLTSDGSSRDRVYWRPDYTRNPAHAGMDARDWQEALAGARITGITHNVPYLRSILAHQGFRNAELHTGFLAQAHSEICT